MLALSVVEGVFRHVETLQDTIPHHTNRGFPSRWMEGDGEHFCLSFGVTTLPMQNHSRGSHSIIYGTKTGAVLKFSTDSACCAVMTSSAGRERSSSGYASVACIGVCCSFRFVVSILFSLFILPSPNYGSPTGVLREGAGGEALNKNIRPMIGTDVESVVPPKLSRLKKFPVVMQRESQLTLFKHVTL